MPDPGIPKHKAESKKEQPKNPIERAVALIDPLTAPRVREAHEEIRNKDSYVIEKPDLVFYGTRHTNDPERPLIKELHDRLGAELAHASGRTVLMVEGFHGDPRFEKTETKATLAGLKDEAEAVRLFGEGGVALWAAKEAAERGAPVEIVSPETPEEALIAESLKTESPQDIAAYLTLRQLTTEIGRESLASRSPAERRLSLVRHFYAVQEKAGVDWIRDPLTGSEIIALRDSDPAAFQTWLDTVGEQFVAGLNARLRSTGASAEGVAENFHALVSRDMERISMADVNQLSDPGAGGRGMPTNRISAAWNKARDRYLVTEIGNAMAAGKKPFVIFGASHAIAVERALDALAEA